ncbi:hypothetical protein PIB30_074294 [Stylosanthes scabra]|uniref:Uncharacterized protein n=1 Tax=Stylosanthes scabra TaxID=79078 RepID=A0ABU6UTB8_9FABA|nr:hypothetical protein [Stylosanthes scabra]
MADEEILDAHCFRTLFNQRLFEETMCSKKIIPEVGFNIREGLYPEVREQILKRGWRRLVIPRLEVAKAVIREFYANVARTEEQVAGLDQHPYTSYVRRVMRFKEETPGAHHNYHHRRPTNEELNEVLRYSCEEGATWKMEQPPPQYQQQPQYVTYADFQQFQQSQIEQMQQYKQSQVQLMQQYQQSQAEQMQQFQQNQMEAQQQGFLN